MPDRPRKRAARYRGGVRSAFLACLAVARSPAPPPPPVVAELVVPPIVDAGAHAVVRPAPPLPSEPPAKSAEQLAQEECRAVMLHIAGVHLDGAGLPPDQRKTILESVMQTFDGEKNCTILDETVRKCMLAAATTADISACSSPSTPAPPPAPPPPPRPRPRPRKP